MIFLAPTVPLCHQQAAVISTEAGKLLGGRPPRVMVSVNHRTSNWKGMSLQKTILVATPQKFRNDVSDTAEGKLPWNRCSLLVMDECHHAMKSHPYSLVMEGYNETRAKPRFLGLTASPAAHASNNKVEARISTLCNKLCSRIATLPQNDVTSSSSSSSLPSSSSPSSSSSSSSSSLVAAADSGVLYRDMKLAVNIPEISVVDTSSGGPEGDPFSAVANKIEAQMRLGIRRLFEGDRRFTAADGTNITKYSDLYVIMEWLASGAGPAEAADIFHLYLAAETAAAFGAVALLHLADVNSTEAIEEIKDDLAKLSQQDPPKLQGNMLQTVIIIIIIFFAPY